MMYMYMLTMLSLVFSQMNHPLALGLILLIKTMLISMMTGMISQSFWFAYILFLIFLGGMLVLFIYVTSLASNEFFFMSSKMLMWIPLLLMMLLYMKNHFYINNQETMNYMTIESTSSYSIMKLYNQPTNTITIMMASYLFLTLIVVVKIINIFKGPLRKIN